MTANSPGPARLIEARDLELSFGSTPALRIIASVLREVSQAGLW